MERRENNNQIEEIRDMLMKGLQEIREELRAHIVDEEEDLRDLREIKKVLHGNTETGDIGMVRKVNDMYDIITQAKGVGNFFGGMRGVLGLMITMGAAIVVLKGWLK